jgi:hypothetical protein
MRSHVSRADGVASVRRAYVPEEIRDVLRNQPRNDGRTIEISRHYLFRMGVIVWKAWSQPGQTDRLRRIA